MVCKFGLFHAYWFVIAVSTESSWSLSSVKQNCTDQQLSMQVRDGSKEGIDDNHDRVRSIHPDLDFLASVHYICTPVG